MRLRCHGWTRLSGTAALGAGVGLLLGCVRIGLFPCERDSQCQLDGRSGRCVDPGFCALPDPDCDDGYRFHDHGVPEDLAGHCAALPDPGSTGSSSSGPPATGSSSSGGSSSSDEGGSSSTTGTDCGDHPCGCTASVGAGTNHTCVVRFDGEVVCWGANGVGELGMGTTSNPIPWPQRVDLPGEMVATEVHEGNNHTCVRTPSNVVMCWGRNSDGEIDPTRIRTETVLGPTPLPLVEPPGVIGMAPQHTCVASQTDPGLRCLGDNDYGELGGMDPAPVDVDVGTMGAVDELALGRDHSCARVGARVWCWGRNNFGQLGDPMVMGSTDTPNEVVLPGDATILAGGRYHNCVVLDSGAEVVCWGRNVAGQVGDGTETNATTPTAIAGPLPAPVVSLDGRLDTTCALLEDGDVWCWGGSYGQDLGTAAGPDDLLTVPMRVEVIDELPEPVVEVDVGTRHLCARAESGRLWCWGRDDNEQLGPIDPPVGKRAVELDVECPPGIGR